MCIRDRHNTSGTRVGPDGHGRKQKKHPKISVRKKHTFKLDFHFIAWVVVVRTITTGVFIITMSVVPSAAPQAGAGVAREDEISQYWS